MIDWGCTTTSIRSYGVPNRWWASISSSPLFISVAESIVILPPIAHVGCASACSTVTWLSSSAVRPRNGPPDAVRITRSTVPGTLGGQQLVDRRVLGVDRDDRGAGGLGQLRDQLAPDDQRLLVGQRQIDPLAERRDRRHQPGRADDPVEHELALALGDQPDQPLGTRPAPRRRSTPRWRARPRPDPPARSAAPRARAPGPAAAPRRRRRSAPTTSRSAPALATTSSAWTPIEPVEPRMARRRGTRDCRPRVAGRSCPGPAAVQCITASHT